MILIYDGSLAGHDGHIAGSQFSFDTQHQFPHNLLLACYNLGQIKRNFRHADRVFGCVACIVIRFCRVQ